MEGDTVGQSLPQELHPQRDCLLCRLHTGAGMLLNRLWAAGKLWQSKYTYP